MVNFFFDGWEPVVRVLVVGTLGYASLVALLRTSGTRTLAQMSSFDFVVTVALGASFGRVLTARSVALVEAVTAFALLVVLQLVLTSVQVRVPRFASLVTAEPTVLFHRGEVRQEALRRARLTEAELRSAVRKHGAGTLDEVDAVLLEADGTFSVISSGRLGDGGALP